MRLQVGPVPSLSVRAWVAYAREKVDELGSDPFEADMPSDIVEVFETYLDAWTEAADAGEEFWWEAEIPSEVAEYQVHAFHQIVSRLAQAAVDRGEPEQPPEAEPFYQSLVNAIIDGLEMEGASTAEYATHLRSFWPGLGDSAAEAADASDESA